MEKTFRQNSDYFCYRFIKNDILCLCICFVFTKNPIISSLFKITLNLYILTILTCPLKTYVDRLHNLFSMNIFFTADHERS